MSMVKLTAGLCMQVDMSALEQQLADARLQLNIATEEAAAALTKLQQKEETIDLQRTMLHYKNHKAVLTQHQMQEALEELKDTAEMARQRVSTLKQELKRVAAASAAALEERQQLLESHSAAEAAARQRVSTLEQELKRVAAASAAALEERQQLLESHSAAEAAARQRVSTLEQELKRVAPASAAALEERQQQVCLSKQ
jgi:chromosome segregation ATPase